MLLNPESEDFKSGVNIGASAVSTSDKSDLDFDDTDLIVTFDEGLSIVGMYADLTSALDDEDVDVKDFEMTITFDGINDGTKVKLPKDAKNAKEKTADEDDGLFSEIGLDDGSDVPEIDVPAMPPAEEPENSFTPVIPNLPAETQAPVQETKAVIEPQVNVSHDGMMDINVNGMNIAIKETVLQDVMDLTGMAIDQEDLGTMVNKGSYEIVRLTTGNDKKYLNIGVSNNTESALPAENCTVSYISYADLTLSDRAEKDSLVSINGITLGSSKDEVYAVFGEPTEIYSMIEDYSFGSMSIEFTYDDNNLVESMNISDYT